MVRVLIPFPGQAPPGRCRQPVSCKHSSALTPKRSGLGVIPSHSPDGAVPFPGVAGHRMGRPLQGAQSGRFCFRALGTGALQTGGDTSSEIVPLALPSRACYIIAVAQTLEVLNHLGRPGLSPETGLFAYLDLKNGSRQRTRQNARAS